MSKNLLFVPVAMAIVFATPALAASADFATWLKGVRSEASASGISQKTIEEALPVTLTPIARVLELDRKQPEKTRTFEQYLDAIVNKQRIDKGREKFSAHRALLTEIGKVYGVEPQVIVALWGIETNYGKNTGGYDVVTALATLAWDGRREAFFRAELLNALKILDEEHISHADMKGSWAGAMGQSQFMPSSFLRFAEDYNKDGKRDIWKSEADVFASAANYLAKSGWEKGQPWGRAVQLTKPIDRSLLGVDTTRSLQFWHDRGVRMADGKSIPFEGAYEASLIQPDGPGTSAFIVYNNYKVIMKWNKSTYFATSVGMLSDKIKPVQATTVNN